MSEGALQETETDDALTVSARVSRKFGIKDYSCVPDENSTERIVQILIV